MKTCKRNTALRMAAFVMVAAMSVVAQAQVVQLNTGQSLDANYQIGSGGYNTVVGGVGGVNSQLIAQRQVTGLAAFHGRSIAAPNELGVTSPTAGIDQFLRESVGVRQAVQGSNYLPTPYYNPNLTVFNVPAVTSGLTPPGTNAPMGGVAAIQRVYSDVTQDYRILSAPVTGVGITPQLMPGNPLPGPIMAITRPGSTALFGVPEFLKRQQLAQELVADVQRSAASGASPTEIENPVITGQYNSEDRMRGTGPQVGGQRTLGSTNRADVRQELSAGTRGGIAGMPPANQDVYVDLLLGLQEQRRTAGIRGVRPGITPPGEVKGQEPGEIRPGEPKLPGSANLIETGPEGVIIHGLAGRHKDMFNTYMTRAQELLKHGRYYDASKQFEFAIIANGDNPMARLGAGLAIFAAGEPYSAGIQIRQAMQMFPPLMETRVDYKSMMSIDDFNKSLEILARRIEKETAPDSLLLFLGAYMNQSAGQTAAARKYAQMLKDGGTTDRLFLGYAGYVLTGKLPTTLPSQSLTTQPAGRTAAPSPLPDEKSIPAGK